MSHPRPRPLRVSPLSRRRFLIGGSALAALATGVVSCAGAPAAPATAVPPTADSGRPAATAASSPAPAAAQPRRGGRLRFPTTSTYAHLDLQLLPSTTLVSYGIGNCFSRLIRFETGPDIPQPSSRVGPDLAESWEQPDDLTYIFKMRPSVKWHNVAPVNGRETSAEDI